MSLPAIKVVRHLTVIEGGRPKRGRPSKADEATLELAARRSEEQAMADLLFPLLQKAKLAARHHGRTEFEVVAAIDHLLTRHARRWADEEPERVA